MKREHKKRSNLGRCGFQRITRDDVPHVSEDGNNRREKETSNNSKAALLAFQILLCLVRLI